ncbi:MAG: hypothetical protein ACTHQM_23750, partial [Thermoanaerobaculia bacterium]
MKTRHLLILVITALSSFRPAVFAQDRQPLRVSSVIQAKLRTPFNRVLPGVPLEMWVDLTNPSDVRAGVGLCADMFVEPPQGEPFWITFGAEESAAYPTLLPQRRVGGPAQDYLLLKPRDSAVVTLPFESELRGPAYFADPRLANPGIYKLSLRLDYCWPPFIGRSASTLPPEFSGAVTTDVIEIERTTPQGEDLVVWSRMKEAANNAWSSTNWPPSVVGEVITEHQSSNYFPYAVAAAGFGTSREKYAALIAEAQDRFPESPIMELLQESAQRVMRTACITKQGRYAGVCKKAETSLRASKRPTTRIRIDG